MQSLEPGSLASVLGRHGVNRRDLLRLAAIGVGGVTIPGLLVACGGDDDDDENEDADNGEPVGATPEESPEDDAGDDSASGPSVLRIGHDTEVASNIDPQFGQGYTIAYLENMYEPLAYPLRDTFEIEPVLAESYELAEDGTGATFKVRGNVKFHDGSILDAETVKFSFERLMTMGLAYAQAELNTYVKGISTPDASTIVFDIDPGGAPFIAVQTGLLVVSRQAVEENRTDADPLAQDYFALAAAGTGPYKLIEMRPRDVMRIAKFDEYWRGWEGKHIDEAVWMQLPERATQALMLERDELDVSFLVPLESLPAMREDPKYQVIQNRGNYTFYFRMATNSYGDEPSPLENKTLRQALAHAFDYDAWIAARADYLPPDGPVASQFLGGWVPENLPKYDIERAKQLYAEAGYGPDNPVRIEQAIPAGYDYQDAAAAIMQQGLAQLGADYNITQAQWATIRQGLLRWIETGDRSGAADMFTLKMPSNIPDAVAQLNAYRTGGDLNLMGYSNPEIDALLEEALLNPDPDARIELYKNIVTKIVDDVPDIWLGVEQPVTVLGASVKGFYQHPLWFPAVPVYSMYFEE